MPENTDPYPLEASIEQLRVRGIDFHTVAAQAGKPDADPFDLLCHLAFKHGAYHVVFAKR